MDARSGLAALLVVVGVESAGAMNRWSRKAPLDS